ncbi:hypothetical protein PVAND_004470 [Polypedilum vanderplanki]|uniref:RalBP1-associated Eps domain-containing protein n=1 Tax=Polypedilum vanderplanki TaxID=319348 RepID=A0A9J6BX92_POLVA|nr:hypothetical protein PVAND_004470 [Polypedilum vanderplanki]
MDVSLTESENKYYNDLFTLCDVEKIGKIETLKANELFRSAEDITEEVLTEINLLAGNSPSFLYLSRNQFYSCLKLIGAYQAKILPLREEILTSTTIQLPLPKFSWKLELEPPPELVAPSTSIKPNQTPNGLLTSAATASICSPDLIELSSKESHHHHHHHLTVDRDRNVNSDLPSTDSEMEATDNERDTRIRLGVNQIRSTGKQGKSKRSGIGGGGSPTWSTTSDCDSPTPMNSRIESSEVNSQSWQGLLCEEQTQLLGTEEESSDRHSSDEDDDDLDLEALYQITSEQKEYYLKQFRTVQPVVSGLLSGVVAKVFFEKSRIPVEELRHIWQLCDVTRDGALDVAEFTAAMHLVVLRRNNIPIPSVLPTCLQPHILCKTLGLPQQQQQSMVEADLLNLESDDNQNNHHVTQRTNVVNKNEYQRMISSTYDDYRTIGSGAEKSTTTIMNKSSTLPKNHFSSQYRGEGDGSASNNHNINNNLNLNLHNNNNNNKQMSKNVIMTSSTNTALNSGSNSPQQTLVDGGNIDGINANKEWTKFTESPTSNVSSPGPKPVNVTQAIVSDPSHVIHPVPLRVTPVGATELGDEEAIRTFRKADTLVYESGVIKAAQATILERDGSSPKQHFNAKQQPSSSYVQHHQRDSLPNDLRAIQRPHPKKPASKNIGQIPMPPSSNESNQVTLANSGGTSILGTNKKEIPPLPPPRPHRHTRSSSLDLQRIKLSNNNATHDKEAMSSQPPELPPPRISDKSFKMPSVDTYVESSTTNIKSKKNEESFADFTQFPDPSSKQQKSAGEYVTTIRLDNPPVPQPRLTLTNTTIIGPSSTTSNGSMQRTSAFEIYRKPSRSRSSQSPPIVSTQQQQNEVKIQEYEKQVHAISENLRQVKFPRNANDQNSQELLKYLKEQNSLLIRLCSDLSDELMSVQKKKEDIRSKLDNQQK